MTKHAFKVLSPWGDWCFSNSKYYLQEVTLKGSEGIFNLRQLKKQNHSTDKSLCPLGFGVIWSLALQW